MTEKTKAKRLSKVAREFNIATTTIIEFLKDKKIDIGSDPNPNTKLDSDVIKLLLGNFSSDKLEKEYTDEENAKDIKEEEERIRKIEEREEYLREVKEELLEKEEEKDAKEEQVEAKDEEEKIEIPEEKQPKAKEEQPEIIEEKKEEKTEPKKVEKEEKEEEKVVIESKKKDEEPVKEIEEKEKTIEKKDEVKSLKIVGKIKLEDPKEKKKAKKEKKKLEKEKEEAKKKEKKEAKKEEEKKKKEEKEQGKEIEEKKDDVKEIEEKKIETEPKEKTEQDKEAVVKKEAKEEEVPEGKGLKIIGKIDVDQFTKKKKKRKPVASTSDPKSIKRKRRRVFSKKAKPNVGTNKVQKDKNKPKKKPIVVDDKQIQKQVSSTLAKLTSKQKGEGVQKAKERKKKKKEIRQKQKEESLQQEKNILELIEFITVNELANMMDVHVTEVIMVCMNLGLMVNINQRLDAETIQVVADEFGFETKFKSESTNEPSLEEPDNEENLAPRSPVVTIMGHVDHGKTSLLDYIRKSQIIKGEAGGITQHIGAYKVDLKNGKSIAFLDTPGHEAFTSMRARGAKVTDIVIVVVAADDNVMPQTKEAISHAQAANVPIVFAINKIDREVSDPEKIKKQLSEMNLLVEDWGGKIQSQEISAKTGLNVDELLEKVLLEAEMLELTADNKKRGTGTVVEASLDKGKGIITNILIQKGTIKIGDSIIAGAYYGRVKAMVNEYGKKVKIAGPSTPVEILGLDGAPTAGDVFYVLESEHKAKSLANQRKRLLREQGIRASKHITLEEIGRRIALGSFKELNVIIKGDVDGSVEALSDSLQKLSNEEVQVNIVHKGVGQISESDILLATATDAIIIGFQVRPSLNARKLAEKDGIDVRTYSVIYDAIEELKLAIEGMLEPTEKEVIVCNIEVRDVFKITKAGTIAGSKVMDGKITRNTNIRVLREGVIVFTGEIDSLKRFKEDAKEVKSGYECGIGIKNFNDIKVGDIIEGYKIEMVKKELK